MDLLSSNLQLTRLACQLLHTKRKSTIREILNSNESMQLAEKNMGYHDYISEIYIIFSRALRFHSFPPRLVLFIDQTFQ